MGRRLSGRSRHTRPSPPGVRPAPGSSGLNSGRGGPWAQQHPQQVPVQGGPVAAHQFAKSSISLARVVQFSEEYGFFGWRGHA